MVERKLVLAHREAVRFNLKKQLLNHNKRSQELGNLKTPLDVPTPQLLLRGHRYHFQSANPELAATLCRHGLHPLLPDDRLIYVACLD